MLTLPPVMFISVRAPIADMWGPVVTDPKDKFYCNCAIGSNNTGELCGMLNALLWAKRQGGEEAFAICYDSKYAKNNGIWKPRKNTSIGQLCNRLFREEQQRLKIAVKYPCIQQLQPLRPLHIPNAVVTQPLRPFFGLGKFVPLAHYERPRLT